MINETITWHSAHDSLPDSELTVLVYAPSCSDPVWLGFHDGESWVADNAVTYDEGQVVAWAEMPVGPHAVGSKPL
jgi:hypothetical protein